MARWLAHKEDWEVDEFALREGVVQEHEVLVEGDAALGLLALHLVLLRDLQRNLPARTRNTHEWHAGSACKRRHLAQDAQLAAPHGQRVVGLHGAIEVDLDEALPQRVQLALEIAQNAPQRQRLAAACNRTGHHQRGG